MKRYFATKTRKKSKKVARTCGMLPTISLLFPFFWSLEQLTFEPQLTDLKTSVLPDTPLRNSFHLFSTLSWEGGSQILTPSYLFYWSMIGSSLSIYFVIFIFPTINPMVRARIMDVTAARTPARALRFAIYCATKHNSLTFLSSIVHQIYIQKFNDSFLQLQSLLGHPVSLGMEIGLSIICNIAFRKCSKSSSILTKLKDYKFRKPS